MLKKFLHRTTALIILLCLIFSFYKGKFIIGVIANTGQVQKIEPLRSPISAQSTHDVIEIVGNGEFNATNGVIGGSGSELDPYIISGWVIDAAGESAGISLDTTTSYVIIENCEIYHSQRYGIYVNSAENVEIRNCEIHSMTGVHGADATASSFAGTGYPAWGIYCYLSSILNIQGNTIRNLTGGNGGDGWDGSATYMNGGSGQSAAGIYVDSGSPNYPCTIISNVIENLHSGNGGHGGLGATDEDGGTGGTAGNIYGIHYTHDADVNLISGNILRQFYGGIGGEGGAGGSSTGSGGLNGGHGGNSGYIFGIRFYYLNTGGTSTNFEPPTTISDNILSEFYGGQGGDGGAGSFGSSTGGNGGSGGIASGVEAIISSHAINVNLFNNTVTELISAVAGTGGIGGAGTTSGNSGVNGSPGGCIGFEITFGTNFDIQFNTVNNLKNHILNPMATNRAFWMKWTNQTSIISNTFDASSNYIGVSQDITLHSATWGNYWGIYAGAVDILPKDGIMDSVYLISGDNLTDSAPLSFPFDADPDGDTYSMIEELEMGLNPRMADTDSDSIADNVELELNLNPLNPSDAAMDFDNDGLSNLQEILYGTEILFGDTDNDTWLDGIEIIYGSDPLNNSDFPIIANSSFCNTQNQPSGFESFAQNYGALTGTGLLAIAVVVMGLIKKP